MDVENYQIKLVESSKDFWFLYDALENDNSALIYDRTIILDSYTNKQLFSLYHKETMKMLQCFVSIDYDHDLEIIWVHTKISKQGVGSYLVKKINPVKILNPLDDARKFWTAMGYINEHKNADGDIWLSK